uniref:Transposon Ty3-I Gag-Pol polyprotein n=1 Tax=Cajanus cajan TaxID=3821 RepID=A0A151RGL1_CAJCA|nr:Transposon Ty3-I Gag-Pol polyprotein [Cajanus cajan]
MPGLDRGLVEHRLPMIPGKKPVKQSLRRFAPEVIEKIKEEIERLLKAKFIRTSRYAEWISNVVPVIKKNGKLRVFIDFRDLNTATPKDEYPMPIAETMIDAVAGATYQRAMNLIFHDLIGKFVQVYIDDIIVGSKQKEDYLCHLKLSFERMRKHGLKMNPLKCAFGVTAGEFLGFVIHQKGIEVNRNKTKAIMETKPPSNKKELQSLLGEEIRYTPLEKLCLSLYVACTKLKYYIRPCDVVILCKPVLHSRVGKWALALTEYSLNFEPLKATKGQVIADFLADHSKETEEVIYLTTKPWKLFFDGSKHELGTGIGLLIISPEGLPTKLSLKTYKGYSNNETKYQALITGLEILKELGARNVSIRGDSQLVIKQLTQEYKCLNEKLIEFKTRAV